MRIHYWYNRSDDTTSPRGSAEIVSRWFEKPASDYFVVHGIVNDVVQIAEETNSLGMTVHRFVKADGTEPLEDFRLE